jgi:hypothetical protein
MEAAQKQSGQAQKGNKQTNKHNKFHEYNEQKIKEHD